MTDMGSSQGTTEVSSTQHAPFGYKSNGQPRKRAPTSGGFPKGYQSPAQFKPGHGHHMSRRKHVRLKISTDLIQTLHDVFHETATDVAGEPSTRGLECIRKLSESDPLSFLTLIAKVVPKDLHVEHTHSTSDMTQAERKAEIQRLMKELGYDLRLLQPVIEGERVD